LNYNPCYNLQVVENYKEHKANNSSSC